MKVFRRGENNIIFNTFFLTIVVFSLCSKKKLLPPLSLKMGRWKSKKLTALEVPNLVYKFSFRWRCARFLLQRSKTNGGPAGGPINSFSWLYIMYVHYLCLNTIVLDTWKFYFKCFNSKTYTWIEVRNSTLIFENGVVNISRVYLHLKK